MRNVKPNTEYLIFAMVDKTSMNVGVFHTQDVNSIKTHTNEITFSSPPGLQHKNYAANFFTSYYNRKGEPAKKQAPIKQSVKDWFDDMIINKRMPIIEPYWLGIPISSQWFWEMKVKCCNEYITTGYKLLMHQG